MADDPVAYPTLDEAEIALLAAFGERQAVAAGDYLFHEGDATYDFYVVLSGAVEIIVRSDGEERVITRHGPGRFLGELSLLTGQRAFVSARVAEPGEVLVVPAEMLRRILRTSPSLGDTILAAFVERRQGLLRGASATIRVVGSRYSPESLRLREFLARNRIPHEWLDAEIDPGVERLLRQSEVPADELPVVIAFGVVMRRATPGEVASYLGLTVERLPDRCFDLVVVGAGPAGLAAAVYAASEGLRTLVIELESSPVARPGAARASRTTWASRPGSPAATSPNAP